MKITEEVLLDSINYYESKKAKIRYTNLKEHLVLQTKIYFVGRRDMKNNEELVQYNDHQCIVSSRYSKLIVHHQYINTSDNNSLYASFWYNFDLTNKDAIIEREQIYNPYKLISGINSTVLCLISDFYGKPIINVSRYAKPMKRILVADVYTTLAQKGYIKLGGNISG